MNCLPTRTFRLSDTGVEMGEFWESAKAGRLMVPHCRSCQKPHWYPRAVCPHCFSGEIDLVQASGRGTIYSFTVMRRVKEPYVLAFVTLDEGVTMLTNIIDCDPDALEIGQAVKVSFQPAGEDRVVPAFCRDDSRGKA